MSLAERAISAQIASREEPTLRPLTTRQNKIDSLMKTPVVKIGRDHSSDTTVLIPLHNDPRRYETAELAIGSLKNQGVPLDEVHVVIADNGISDDGVARMKAAGDAHGIDITFADARAKTATEKSPAFARNKALNLLAGWRLNEEKFKGPVLEVDSDNILKEGAIGYLRETLSAHENAVAVSGEIVPVSRLEDVENREQKYNGRVRALPDLWDKNGQLDIAAIVAFSSQVAGKTTGLLLDPSVLWGITAKCGELYVQMPGKSAEDMIASAALGRHGVIYQDTRAEFYDEARENPAETRSQQLNWGKDHVYLADDLAKVGLIETGLHVLEPQEQGWVEWKVPGTDSFSGVIINPLDVAATARMLKGEFSSGYLKKDGVSLDVLRKLARGLHFIDDVADSIDQARSHADMRDRADLPRPTVEDPTSPRFTSPAKIGRLMGNVIGMTELHDMKSTSHIPQTFLFGGRQSASWT